MCREALRINSFVAGYEHDWAERWTSTLAYSLARIDNIDAQAADAIHKTQTASINLVWQPFERLLTGVEYLYGTRENHDDEDGFAHRLQFSFKFLF